MSFCTLDTTTERQVVFLCPYDEEDIKDIAQRAARDEDGEVYYVPDDMTYQEWEKILFRVTSQTCKKYLKKV